MSRIATSKARANRVHARRRCHERFGIDLSDVDLDRIEGLIRAGAGPDCVPIRVDHFHRDRSLHAVRFGGVWLPTLFDAATDSMLSVLPPHALDVYRKALETVATPAPPAPAPADEGPPVGTILGMVEVPPAPPPDDLPPLGADPTLDEVARVQEAVKTRKESVHMVLSHLKGPAASRRERQRLLAELARLNEFGRELKRLHSHVYHRNLSASAGVADPDDPAALLRSLFAAFCTVGHRLDWDLTDREQAARNAAQDYLNRHKRGSHPARHEDRRAS